MKPTDVWHSDPDLGYYLDGLVCGTIPAECNGVHTHLTGQDADDAKILAMEDG